MFEGPAGVCGVVVTVGFNVVVAAPRRLRGLVREELLFEDAIPWERRCAGTGIPWHQFFGGFELVAPWRRSGGTWGSLLYAVNKRVSERESCDHLSFRLADIRNISHLQHKPLVSARPLGHVTKSLAS